MRILSNALLLCLLLVTTTRAQINLPAEVSPYEPIVGGCNCTPPEGAEVHIRWLISSEPEAEATLIDVPDNKVHIWGTPGKHRLLATVVWLLFEEVEVVTPDGGTKTIRNLIQWNTETYQHDFVILGPAPQPDNQPPVANAGAAQTVKVGDIVHLDASGSTDPDGDDLSYLWLLMPPAGSSATLNQSDAIQPSFTADKAGLYRARVTVDDGQLSDATTTEVTAGAVVGEGPRHLIIIEESGERTPRQADVIVDIRELLRTNSTMEKHSLWVYDKDTQSSWLPSYERRRQEAGQSLPCLFITDKQTNEQLYLGPLPDDSEAFLRLIKEHGG